MDENKQLQDAIPEEETAVKKFDIKTAIDIWMLVKVVFVVGAAAVMSYLTVWWEYLWLAKPGAKASYANMLRYWLVNNKGVNTALFYSLIVCGFIVWCAVFAALVFLITKAVRAIIKELNARKAARG